MFPNRELRPETEDTHRAPSCDRYLIDCLQVVSIPSACLTSETVIAQGCCHWGSWPVILGDKALFSVVSFIGGSCYEAGIATDESLLYSEGTLLQSL